MNTVTNNKAAASAYKSINKDQVLNHQFSTNVEKIPQCQTLAEFNNYSGLVGNIAFQRSDQQFYGHNGTTWIPLNGTGSGTITGGLNEGTGVKVFDDSLPPSNTLTFRTLLAGGNITLTQNAQDITITASGAATELTSLLPSDELLVDGTIVGPYLTIKGLNAGPGITLTDNVSNIEIAQTAPPDAINLYVSSTLGNDVTGTGTIGFPYATIDRAFVDIQNTGYNDTATVHILSTGGAVLSTTSVNAWNSGGRGKQKSPVCILGERNIPTPDSVVSWTTDPASNLLILTTTNIIYTFANVGQIVRFTTGPLATFTPTTSGLVSIPPQTFTLEAFISEVISPNQIRLAFSDTFVGTLDGSLFDVYENNSLIRFTGTNADINAAVITSSNPIIFKDIDFAVSPTTSTLTTTPVDALVFDNVNVYFNGVRYKISGPVDPDPNAFKVNALLNLNGSITAGSTPVNLFIPSPLNPLPSVLGFAAFYQSNVPANAAFIRPDFDSSRIIFANSMFHSPYQQIQGNFSLKSCDLVGSGDVVSTVSSPIASSLIANSRFDGLGVANNATQVVGSSSSCNVENVHILNSQGQGILAVNGGIVTINDGFNILIENCNIGMNAKNGGLIVIKNSGSTISEIIGTNNQQALATESNGKIILDADNLLFTGSFQNIININTGEFLTSQDYLNIGASATVLGDTINIDNGGTFTGRNLNVRSTGNFAISLQNSSKMNINSITVNSGKNALFVNSDSELYVAGDCTLNTGISNGISLSNNGTIVINNNLTCANILNTAVYFNNPSKLIVNGNIDIQNCGNGINSNFGSLSVNGQLKILTSTNVNFYANESTIFTGGTVQINTSSSTYNVQLQNSMWNCATNVDFSSGNDTNIYMNNSVLNCAGNIDFSNSTNVGLYIEKNSILLISGNITCIGGKISILSDNSTINNSGNINTSGATITSIQLTNNSDCKCQDITISPSMCQGIAIIKSNLRASNITATTLNKGITMSTNSTLRAFIVNCDGSTTGNCFSLSNNSIAQLGSLSANNGPANSTSINISSASELNVSGSISASNCSGVGLTIDSSKLHANSLTCDTCGGTANIIITRANVDVNDLSAKDNTDIITPGNNIEMVCATFYSHAGVVASGAPARGFVASVSSITINGTLDVSGSNVGLSLERSDCFTNKLSAQNCTSTCLDLLYSRFVANDIIDAYGPSTLYNISIANSILFAQTINGYDSQRYGLVGTNAIIKVASAVNLEDAADTSLLLTNTNLVVNGDIIAINSPTGISSRYSFITAKNVTTSAISNTGTGCSLTASTVNFETFNGDSRSNGLIATLGSKINITKGYSTSSCSAGTGTLLSRSEFIVQDDEISITIKSCRVGMDASYSFIVGENIDATACTITGFSCLATIVNCSSLSTNSCANGLTATNGSVLNIAGNMSSSSCTSAHGISLTQSELNAGVLNIASCATVCLDMTLSKVTTTSIDASGASSGQANIQMTNSQLYCTGDINVRNAATFGINANVSVINITESIDATSSVFALKLNKTSLVALSITMDNVNGQYGFQAIESEITLTNNRDSTFALSAKGSPEFAHLYLVKSTLTSLGNIIAQENTNSSGIIMDASKLYVGTLYNIERPENYGLNIINCKEYGLLMYNGSFASVDYINANASEITITKNRIDLTNSELYVNGSFIPSQPSGVTAYIKNESLSGISLLRSKMVVTDLVDLTRTENGDQLDDSAPAYIVASTFIVGGIFKVVSAYTSSLEAKESVVSLLGGVNLTRATQYHLKIYDNSKLTCIGQNPEDPTQSPIDRTDKYAGILIDSSSSGIIRNIYVSRSTLNGIIVSRSSQLTISNCRLEDNQNAGILVYASSKLTMDSISGNNTNYGVQIRSNSHVSELSALGVSTNTVTGGIKDVKVGVNGAISWSTIEGGTNTDVSDYFTSPTEMCSCVKYESVP
jgi:hypothetical protein